MSTSSHFRTPCPQCHRDLKVRLEYVGKQVTCKHCGLVFTVPAPREEAPSARAPEGDELSLLEQMVLRESGETSGPIKGGAGWFARMGEELATRGSGSDIGTPMAPPAADPAAV